MSRNPNRQARRAMKAAGYADSLALYKGPSTLTGDPIRVLATGKYTRSSNEKTGPMVQVWFLPEAENIASSRRTGLDRSVCGDCKFAGGKGCYVTPMGPTSAWKNRDRARPPMPGELRGESIRLGAWGDPTSAPWHVTRDLVRKARRWTGYTHQWTTCDERFRAVLMASVDTAEEKAEAKRQGWRTFRTIGPGESLEADEIMCPATTTPGVTCNTCGLCNGAGSAKSIAVEVHGSAKNVANASKALVQIGGTKR